MSPELSAVVLVLATLLVGLMIVVCVNVVADASTRQEWMLAGWAIVITIILMTDLGVLMAWLLF